MRDSNPNIHSTEIRELADWVSGIPLVDGETGERSGMPGRAAALLDTLACMHELLSDSEFNPDTFQALGDMFSLHGLELFDMDRVLDEERLQQKYRGDPGEAKMPNQHPNWPLAEWTSAVAKGETERGYWEWVKVQIEDHD